jgi:hypothetical protein
MELDGPAEDVLVDQAAARMLGGVTRVQVDLGSLRALLEVVLAGEADLPSCQSRWHV